jgi:hypothetical protein
LEIWNNRITPDTRATVQEVMAQRRTRLF